MTEFLVPYAQVKQSCQRAFRRLLDVQQSGGDWEGEMVWCSMILAQAVIVRTVLGLPYADAEKAQITRHFNCTQLSDGSWGMHPESPGYVFFTALSYTALRLLGTPADTAMLVKARTWLQAQPDGVKGIPSWGKFWLAMLGLYGYDGINPIPPEIFLLPDGLPFHPRRYYCHTRLIYLGIAFLYGKRFVAPLPASLRAELRQELYAEAYDSIDFRRYRHTIAASDVFVPITPALRVAYTALGVYERWHSRRLRRKGLALCLEKIVYEQRTTRYQGISPVSGLLNCFALFAAGPGHPDLAPSIAAMEAWRWEDAAEGIRYVGARSNTWDTAFVVQAMAEAPFVIAGEEQALNKAHGFFDAAQLTEELPDYQAAWRDPALGGWCFSDGQHRWPVSDCTAEALSALLDLYHNPNGLNLTIHPPLAESRLKQAVEFILSRQNADGGFGTYERRRAGKLLEAINPSEMYGQCMTELSYIECTASALSALSHYLKFHADFPGRAIERAGSKALGLLRNSQLADGSYPGFWGINYTYAIFHVAKAFKMAGVPSADSALQSAAGWLVAKQREDGGWGEHYTSCLKGQYVEHAQSQVVMTSWALLALLDILPAGHPAIKRGFDWLIARQQDNGDWPRQSVNGVFFGAAMLDYRLYHTYFPAWALARYARLTTDGVGR
jgi:2,3-oxidosqualene cyclase